MMLLFIWPATDVTSDVIDSSGALERITTCRNGSGFSSWDTS